MTTATANKEERVLDWLRDEPGTVDEFITYTGYYINSWAPVFTALLQAGKIESIGLRTTSHGGVANVWKVIE